MAHDGAADSNRSHVLALIPSRGLGGGIESYVMRRWRRLSPQGPTSRASSCETEQESTPSLSQEDAVHEGSCVGRSRKKRSRHHRVPRGPRTRCLSGTTPRGTTGECVRDPARLGDMDGRALFRRRWDASSRLHQVAVSSFSAGALAARAAADVLHPGIPRARYERLLAGAQAPASHSRSLRVLSVFRLERGERQGRVLPGRCLSDLKGGRERCASGVCGSRARSSETRVASPGQRQRSEPSVTSTSMISASTSTCGRSMSSFSITLAIVA